MAPNPPLRDDPLLRDVPEVEGYKVLEPCVLYAAIGRGGMGAVYRGKHLNLDLDVAVKCLKSSLAAESPEFVVRFQREARVAAAVNDANLIRVFDVANRYGVHYLVMEYVEGENLQTRVARKGALAPNEAVTVTLGVANGLAAAHARGIIHRDVKPANILISRRGEVKLADLGLARAADAVDSLATGTNMILGTPQYMPPEQFESTKSVGASGDVHALASCLWFMLAGRDAVEPGSLAEVMRRVVLRPFPPLREIRSGLPEALYGLLERATDRDPSVRPPDALSFHAELAAIADAEGWATSLKDAMAGTVHDVAATVSPPPEAALSRIRTMIDSGALVRAGLDGGRRSGGGRGDDGPAETPATREPPVDPDAQTRRSDPETKEVPVPGKKAPRPKAAKAARPARAGKPDRAPASPRPRGATGRRAVGALLLLAGALAGGSTFFGPRSTAKSAASGGPARNRPESLVPAQKLIAFVGFHDLGTCFEVAADLVRATSPRDASRPPRELIQQVMINLSGLPLADRRDLENFHLAADGMALAAYENRVEVFAARTTDALGCRKRIEEAWRFSSEVEVESRSEAGVTVVEQRYGKGGFLERFAVFHEDRVYVSNRTNVDETVSFLVRRLGPTLAADQAFESFTNALPRDRDLTFFARIPSQEFEREPELATLLRGLGAISGAVRMSKEDLDAEFRVELEDGSTLGDLLKPRGTPLVAGFARSNLLLAVEVAFDLRRLLGWIDRTEAGPDFAEFLREADEVLGLDFRQSLLDIVGGRVALVVGRDDAGDLFEIPQQRDPELRVGATRFPVETGFGARRGGLRSSPARITGVPKAALLLGLASDTAPLFRLLERAASTFTDTGATADLTVESRGDGRRLRLDAPGDGIRVELDFFPRQSAVSIEFAGGGVAPSRGDSQFDDSPDALIRGFVDTPEVLRRIARLAPAKSDAEVLDGLAARLRPISLAVDRVGKALVGRVGSGTWTTTALASRNSGNFLRWAGLALAIVGAITLAWPASRRS